MSAHLWATVAELRQGTDAVRSRGQRVAVVPTMGALHMGHLALVREARRRADFVVVTVFVNPTQFGPTEDFAAYPRDLASDIALAESAGADAVFAPRVEEMYPEGETTRVHVSGLTEGLCGRSRPGHFDGVTTIVSKLFLAVGPAVAVFGSKDYQQLQVVRRMARDLLFPIEVVGHPTVREADGLALSSRNSYLSVEDRRRALAIPRALASAAGAHASGERSIRVLRETVRGALDRAGLMIEYVELTDPDDLTDHGDDELVDGPMLLALAVRVGRTRLIDNLVLGRDAPPELSGGGG
ncbi:MAG TPA: pantoate--beta-alanine ligase [Polyangiaceae bacterium]|nr:pantoate--beta-alanine ligase [Polyangiaceae bacterium]